MCGAGAVVPLAAPGRAPKSPCAQYTIGAVSERACTATPCRFMEATRVAGRSSAASSGGVRDRPTSMAGPRGLARSMPAPDEARRLLDRAEEALGEEVRVDVDAEGLGHGAGFYYQPRRDDRVSSP